MDRIKNFRSEIALWKKTVNLHSENRIKTLKPTLESEISKQRPDRSLMLRTKHELAEAYNEEELFWQQKCREQWLEAGDKNTKYFHNCVKGRKIQNRILMLNDDNGQEMYSEGSKGEVAVEYFHELFRSSNPHDLESLFEGFKAKVTEPMNRILTRPVSDEEIKRVAFGIKGSSAPGEDGFTEIFYQHFWHIVGQSVSKEVRIFFQTAVLPPG